MAEIDTALVRIADGTYGACVSCQATIPFERLEVRPTTDRCVNCVEVRR